MLRVEVVKQTHTALKPFVELPFSIYKGDPNWVPPMVHDQYLALMGKRNKLFEYGKQRFFVAYDDDKPVARVLAGVDEFANERTGRKEGYISLFESYPNIDYAKAVLDAAAGALREWGMDTVTGPVAPTYDMFNRGLLVQGFDGPPVLYNPYNPPAYAEYLTKCGYQKRKDYFAYFMSMADFNTARFEPIVQRVQKRFGFRVEHICFTASNKRKLAADIVRVITQCAPDTVDAQMPTVDDMFEEMKVFKAFYRPETSIMAYAGDRPIGLALFFPDYNQIIKRIGGRMFPFGVLQYIIGRSKIDGVRCNMQYVIPEYQNHAVNAVMFYEAFTAARSLGIKWVEGSTVDETNAVSINNTVKAGGKLYRTYRQYEMKL